MRPFAIYPGALDAAELGYWRFGASGGRLTPVGTGPTFTNYGAVAVEDGYRFDHIENSYMRASVSVPEALPQATIECWVRDWTEAGANLTILDFVCGGQLRIRACDNGDASSFIIASWWKSGISERSAQWTSADVLTILRGANPWHVAAVLDANDEYRLRLYVNGILRRSSASGDIVGIGSDPSGYLDVSRYNYAPSCVMDEVRLSKCVRYTTDFPIVRYGEGQRVLRRGPISGGLFAGVRT